MNYYPFHVGDYLAHTAHLEPIEDLAYRRLLDAYYLAEQPLEGTPEQIARLIRLRGHVEVVAAMLHEFFDASEPGRWRHARCDLEIVKFHAMRDGGRKGAANRWRQAGDKPADRGAIGGALAGSSPPYGPPNANQNQNQNQEEQHLPVQDHIPRSESAREVCEDDGGALAPESGKPATSMREALAPATEASIALRAAGVNVTPFHPDLIAACAEGVSPAELVALAAQYPGKPATYVIRAARRQRAEGPARIDAQPRAGPPRDSPRSAVARVNDAARRLEEIRGRTIDAGAPVAKIAGMPRGAAGSRAALASDVQDLRAPLDVEL